MRKFEFEKALDYALQPPEKIAPAATVSPAHPVAGGQ
jgi:hypothetical protein